jgi:flagellar basal-body rod modification protein FlgD
MSTVNTDISGGYSRTSSIPAQNLGQADFLRLMTAQLQAQDPFAPMDNTQMVAQMAQFTNLNNSTEMTASLKTIAEDIKASRIGDAASWIGRSALVDSDVATPLYDGSYAGQVTLEGNATSVKVDYVDAEGKTVHSQELGAQAKGSVSFDWDGKDGGATVATGPLQMVVTATGTAGSVTATTATWTRIAGVQSPAGGGDTKLVTPLGLIAPADAQRLA